MSDNNINIFKDFMSCYQTGDIDKMCGLIHPDCIFHESAELPYGGEFHGPEGFRVLIGQMLSAYTISLDESEVLEAGECVVARVVVTFVSKKSGAAVTMPVVEIYRFAAGKLIDADVFYREPGRVKQLHGPSSHER